MTTPRFVSQLDLGDMRRLVATIIGTDGVSGVTPSMFMFFVKNPLGSVATSVYGVAGASILPLASNVFVKDISCDYAGTWYYRSVATGLGQDAEEWSFFVASSHIL